MFSKKKIRDKDFYFQDLPFLNVGDVITLNEENTHHNVVVLRRKIGEHIVIIDGKGYAYFAEICFIAKKKCDCKILEIEHQAIRLIQLVIAVALTKNKARNEWLYEKAVEIGVDQIHILQTDHAESDKINVLRMNNIISAAMIQSKAFHLPIVHKSLTITESIQTFKSDFPDGLILIAHCEDDKKNHIANEIHKNRNRNTLLLIGPEGDFSENEIRIATESGAIPVSLGPKRLRTETAVIYGTTVFNSINYE